MHRHLSLEELPRKVAELGYEWIELSPRDDFLAWWVHPRAYPERIKSFKKALKDHGVKIASLLPMYRWASPHEDERQTAVRHSTAGTRRTAAAASSLTRRARLRGGARWRSWSPCSRRRGSRSTSSHIRRTGARRFTRPST